MLPLSWLINSIYIPNKTFSCKVFECVSVIGTLTSEKNAAKIFPFDFPSIENEEQTYCHLAGKLQTWRQLNARTLELCILKLMSLLTYKDKTTIHPNGERQGVCLIFIGKSAVDFKAISLHSFSLEKESRWKACVPTSERDLWVWVSVRGLSHKQIMGKKVTLYTMAPSV